MGADPGRIVSIMAGLAILLGACGDDNGNDECLECEAAGGRCAYEECAVADDCWERFACEYSCEASGCREGHACLEEGGESRCDPICDSARCDPGRECLGTWNGTCDFVTCGEIVPCDGAEMCDVFSHECYPTSGTCGVDADCPQFDRPDSSSCRDGFCRAAPPELPSVPGLTAGDEVRVLSPLPGAQFSDESEIVFQWTAVEEDVIAFVLTALPEAPEDVRAFAVWGRGVAAGSAPRLEWSDGHRVVGDSWAADAGAVPRDQHLYLLLQAVEPGELLAVSPLIPFVVGEGWASPGTPCSADTQGSCENPGVSLTCRSGRCLVVCSSHVDCTPEECGAPIEGVRTCL